MMDYLTDHGAAVHGDHTPASGTMRCCAALGIRLVINMRFWRGRPPRDGKPAMRYLRLRTADNPLLPIPAEVLMRGTRRHWR